MEKFKVVCVKDVTDRLLTLAENKRKCVFKNPEKHPFKKKYKAELISKNVLMEILIK